MAHVAATSGAMRLPGRMHPMIREVLADRSLVDVATRMHVGPVHLLFPQVFAGNIGDFHEIFSDIGVDATVAYACKPNKSPVFVRTARQMGASIDVASQNELTAALAAGFTGERISCTGPKSRRFILTALLQGCLISVDSLDELKLIESLLPQVGSARLLLRIADPVCVGRSLQPKLSRFGIARADVTSAMETIGANPAMTLEGFHVHAYELSETRAGFAFDLMELTRQGHRVGLDPSVVNIGGGYRHPTFEDPELWSRYVNELADKVQAGQKTQTWRQNALGLSRNDRGGVSGRESVMGLVSESNPREMLSGIFGAADAEGRTLAAQIAENMFTAMIEPGAGLLEQCGVSLVRVLGNKTAPDGSAITILDANGYNLGVGMQEMIADPLLIDDGDALSRPQFLAGNLCKEGDLLMRRAIQFGREPERGDVLCFLNTAVYASDFEDAPAIGQPMGRKFVVTKDSEGIHLGDEDSFEEDSL